MYACDLETEPDFSRRCAHPVTQPPISTTHPPPSNSRIAREGVLLSMAVARAFLHAR